MDKLQAQNIIKQTFENPFNKERFIGFVKNLLNHIKEAPFTYQGQYIPEAYRGYIQSLERIGKYEAEGSKIDILIIKLQKNTSLERARTMQRNFVAWYLNGSRGGELKDAAIVAYVAPGDEDWRFSLVKMDYKFTETKTGKMKAKEEFTPARRWSFLVGANEKSHTAQSRLIDILTQDEGTLGLATLEDAFNIEKVTKEFFEKYRELFLRTKETLEDIVKKDSVLKKDFTKKNVSTVDFCKKLLGQIVFLYFLQKKGWFGVPMNKKWGEGDKKFLRTLFDRSQAKNKNYFNDYLEPLFYEALARERDDDFYSRFECKIPFLNGGLFDPISNYDWVNTVINLKDEIFSNQTKTKEGDIGDGILDVFDRYNFTVKEDEPLEKEVAVDPEMLGKVFENLLEVKDRKSKGTYYTPREIVHYMCEQSLINYLATELKDKVNKESLEQFVKYSGDINEQSKTNYPAIYTENICQNAKLIDALLAEIKVCDPAIGSGAFPVGMMSEIVKVRVALNKFIKEPERTVYRFKRNCIQSSLYGVDIEPGAVEIAKLRLWLSLIVDEDDIKQIKPLPNLDYKIMQGNSLLEEFEGVKLFDEKLITSGLDQRTQINTLKQRQQELQREYLHPKNKLTERKKAELEKKLEVISKQIKKINKPDKNEEAHPSLFDTVSEAKKKADELKLLHKNFFEATQKKEKDTIKNKIEQLEWELIEATLKEQNKTSELNKIVEFKNSNTKPFFLWKLNFSEVFQEKGGFDLFIANPPYVKEYVNREAFDGLRNSPYYQGKMDIWYIFASRGIDLIKDNGSLTFIAQNNWVTSYGASKLRKKVISDTRILSLIDFGNYKIFDTAGIQTMVMMFQKNNDVNDYAFDYRRIIGKEASIEDVIDLLGHRSNAANEYLTPLINRDKFIDKSLTFSNSVIDIILEKIQSQCNFSLTDKEVAQGIVCPQDYVNKASKELLGNEFKVGEGIFILNSQKKNNAHFLKDELKLIKPFYTTKEMLKWFGDPRNKEWVIYTDSSFKNPINIKPYPNIKVHLDKFKKVITSDNKPYGLHRSRDEYFFEGEKIISVRKCAEPTFTYTDFNCYVSATFYVIKSERIDLKYLTALLNSKLIAFWLRHKGKMQGNNYQIDKEPLLDIPIHSPSSKEQKNITEIVDKVISVVKSDNYLQSAAKQSKVHEYEKQIDKIIYTLYGIESEEIRLIEDSLK